MTQRTDGTDRDPNAEHEFDPPIDGGVVAGHDGSARATAALTWALEEARLRGLPLHVVRAWKLSSAIAETGAPFGTVPSWDECAAAVDKSLARVLDGMDVGEVTVHRHAMHGAAATILLEASRGADLVVVGQRGEGGFAGLVIGSVAEQVVRHAACTVVVVRAQAS